MVHCQNKLRPLVQRSKKDHLHVVAVFVVWLRVGGLTRAESCLRIAEHDLGNTHVERKLWLLDYGRA